MLVFVTMKSIILCINIDKIQFYYNLLFPQL